MKFIILKLKRIAGIAAKAVLFFIGFTLIWVLVYRFINPPETPLMIIRYFEKKPAKNSVFIKWVDYERISRHLPLAVMAAEDQRFLEHSGFDFGAIEKALKNNDSKRRKNIKGASTISQQTAKNVFLWPGRSWLRKGLEVYFTALIELCWGKERIMEVYLNVIETGKGIYGAEATSKTFFHKSAIKMSKEEAALVAAVLPNPRKFSLAHPSPYVIKRKLWIMRQMQNISPL